MTSKFIMSLMVNKELHHYMLLFWELLFKKRKKITDYPSIFVDLEGDIENNDEQIIVSEIPETKHISLNDLLNSKYSSLRESTNDEIDKIQEYKETFTSYDFSTVVLRKEDIDQVLKFL